MPDSDLRVLFVIPGSPDGSSMIFAKRQARAVAERGVSTSEFYLKSRTRPLVILDEVARLRAAIRAFDPHVVHAQFGTMTGFVTGIATRRPVVVTFFGGDLNPGATAFWPRSFGGRVLSQFAARRADGLVCVSSELRDRLWWRRAEVVIIPCGADTRVFYPRPQSEARAILHWGADERVVLINARFDPRRKRIDLARAAVDDVQRRIGPVRFEVMDGSRDPSLVPVLMNAADCLLVTSDSEGSPTVVQEAIASNLPVVSVDVGDVRERLSRVVPSWIVDRDPASLGAALAEILVARQRSNGADVVEDVSLSGVAARLE
ncbi:MAG TPA: glycosyltransferase, partial [Methylomirabilota bacterium]|nr:glycosyltransferase [Methylomirabilota bacterium]